MVPDLQDVPKGRCTVKFKWSFAAKLAQHPLARSALLMLPIGYLVLWSDEFSNLFRYQDKLRAFQIFETETRLLLVYFGAIFVAAGIVIFECFCPKLCKQNEDREDYFNSVVQPQNTTQLSVAIDRIGMDCRSLLKSADEKKLLEGISQVFYRDGAMLKDKHLSFVFTADHHLRQELSRLLFIHFSAVDRARGVASFLSIVIMLLGIVGVLLPSLEVFILVSLKSMDLLQNTAVDVSSIPTVSAS